MKAALSALAMLVLASCGAGTPVYAHEWYPASCCSGVDCARISPQTVRETNGGYVVTIAPGAHPMWRSDRPAPLVVRIPYREAKPSPDGAWHICLNGQGELLCFFAIVGGT